jgi:flagella basal body P-ring formation protein FlgA
MFTVLRFIFFVCSFFIEIEVRAEPFTKISVEKSVKSEILQKVPFTDFDAVVDTWQTNWANLNMDESINVVELDVSPDQRRFNAVIAWGDATKGGVIKKIAGKIQKFITIPVLSKPVSQQTEIKESNISYVRFADDKINPGMVLKKEDIIGKFLRPGRSLQLDKPLLMTDLEVPIAIRKGEEVRIIYMDRFFEISIVGTAKNNGCVGERISFEVGSGKKKIIQATVTAVGRAEIRENV